MIDVKVNWKNIKKDRYRVKELLSYKRSISLVVGESVSPTLSLLKLENHTVRTTITEQEKINLEKGLYNQVIIWLLIHLKN